jgi:hypothetical protein
LPSTCRLPQNVGASAKTPVETPDVDSSLRQQAGSNYNA